MSFKKNRIVWLLFVLAAVLPWHAQQAIAANPSAAAMLPDAPRASQTASSTPAVPRYAPRLAKYIDPAQQTRPLSAKEKLELSGLEQVRPYAFGTEILAAGWGQLLNSHPKYGTDSAGFGERLGAAAIRQSSQAIFADGVMPAVLHQDPRYYRKGSGKIGQRILYSASRVIVTRTDAGNPAVNYSKLIGYAGAAALTTTYYPAVSATWSIAASGYAVSLAGSALGNEVHEFTPDLFKLLHRHHS